MAGGEGDCGLKRVSHKKLLALLHYNPDTGEWTRKITMGGRIPGTKVGYTKKDGYIKIKVLGKTYSAAPLIWFYMTGKRPRKLLDHIDTNPSNCKWNNLRLATKSENRVNSKCKKDNKLGVKGVRQIKNGRYESLMVIKGKRHVLGYFDTAEEANACYFAFAKKNFGSYARAK